MKPIKSRKLTIRGFMPKKDSIFIWLLLLCSVRSYSQQTDKVIPDGTEGEVHTIREPDSSDVKKNTTQWNEFDLGFTTVKLGMGFLYDFVTHSQDAIGEMQADSAGIVLEPTFKTRDFRFIASGRFKTRRTLTWKAGLMYDGVTDAWLVRETGLIIGVPELAGHFFIGRTKEGFSLNKVMNGYAGITLERQIALDVIPILGDGIKWFGYLPKSRVFWNLGVFADWFSEGQGFSTFSSQYAARVGWLPFHNPENNSLLHVGMNYRHGTPLNGEIRLKSRPESNNTPIFIDTGVFASDQSNHYGGEVYYSNGPLLVGSEFYFHSFSSAEAADPTFFGGEIILSYVLTGESKPYNATGGNIYGFVPVAKPVLKGGWGTWEAVLRISTLDLTDGNLQGGKFWRITPMVNWYLSKYLRLEFAYGYGILDRYQLKGATQFFQSRMQFSIL